ncbi:GNAT family N-acetyltransferase [Bacillus subtilis]|uniref:GNAT family N-acetyltransferase n=1 Tax=Bacillus subtilis TaxID=1423 RepID=UPI003D81A020
MTTSVVDPRHRRKQIANQIIKRLSKWAYETGAHHMYHKLSKQTVRQSSMQISLLCILFMCEK